MPDISVASTTDTQEQVNVAAGLPAEAKPEVEATPEVKTEEQAEKKKEEGKEEKPEGEEQKVKPEEGKETPTKGKGGFQKRIDKLTKRNYDLEEKLEHQSQQVEMLMQRLEGKSPSSGPSVEAVAEKPTPEKFDTYEAYVEALADWKADQKVSAALKQEREQSARQTEEHRQREVFDAHNKRMVEAAERYEDFEEVVGQDIQIPEAVKLAAIESENGADIVYYLGKHPEVCERLRQMSPVAAAVETGRISAALTANAEPEGQSAETVPQKPASKAPAPIKPVGGSARTSSVPLDQLDYRDFRKLRDQQEKDRFRR